MTLPNAVGGFLTNLFLQVYPITMDAKVFQTFFGYQSFAVAICFVDA